MNQRTRKLMSIHKALYTYDGIDRLYVSRKERGSGFTSINDSVDTSLRHLEDDIRKEHRKTDNTDQKQPYEHLKRQTSETSNEMA